MKKILLTILVFVLSLSLAGIAIAASPKPPASICFNIAENQNEFSFLIKPMGNIKMSGGPAKFYSIQGVFFDPANDGPAAVSGSGFMDGDVFRFSLNTTYRFQNLAGFGQIDGYWDVVAKTGSMYTYWNSTVRFIWTLVQVSCAGQ